MSFLATIQTDEGLMLFQLTPFQTGGGVKFFIRIIEPVLNSHVYMMQLHKGEWRFMSADKVPSWILKIENLLSDNINQNQPKPNL